MRKIYSKITRWTLLSILGGTALPGYGNEILDQTLPAQGLSTTLTGSVKGQSFVAGYTGLLTKVVLQINDQSPTATSSDIRIQILDGAGTCGSTVLADQTFLNITEFQNYSFVFTTPAALTAGQPYTITINTTDGSSCNIAFGGSTTYSNGDFYSGATCTPFGGGTDLWFETYMSGCFINDQSVSAAISGFYCNGITNISTGSSQTGLAYFLTDGINVFNGPAYGTGTPIDFPTPALNNTTTFQVHAADASGAVRFNNPGSIQYMTVPAPSNLPTGSVVTVEAWVYPVSYPDATYSGVVSYGARNCSPSGTSFLLSMNSAGRPTMATWCNDFIPSSGPAAVLNQWNHIACVIDGQNVRLYLNGYEWNSTLGIMPDIQSGVLNIGSTDNPGRYFDGAIDEVRIWNVARTAAEINNNRIICLNGNEPGLVSYYKFEEGTGTTVADQTGTNDGTLINAPAWVSGSPVCSGCEMDMTQTATVTVTQPNDETVTAASATVCPNTATTIDLGSSQNGFFYFLRDDSNNTIISGPEAGNGNALSLSTGNIAATTTFNVLETANLALTFDGIDDNIVLANESNFDFTTNMTVEFWMKTTNLPLVSALVTKGDDSWRIHGNGAGSVMFAGNGAFPDFNASTDVTDGVWHHIAATYDGANAKLYIDGVLENSIAATGTINNSSYSVAFGENLQATGRHFDGSMDNVRIWNVARTASEISDDMTSCDITTTAGLVAMYNFNDGPASAVLSDYTGNGNDGTYANMTPNTVWELAAPVCDCSLQMTSTATVTVQDNAPTVAAAPSNITVNNDAGVCGAVVTYTNPTFDDDCDGNGLAGIMTSSGTASGDLFAVGTTTVTYTYTDANSQTITASFDVTVTDNEAPVVSGCPANISVNADAAGCTSLVSWTAPTATDNCSTVNTSASHSPGDSFNEGTTTVTYTFSDGAGNSGTCSFDVTVTNSLSANGTGTDEMTGNDGTVTLTVSGGNTPFTYNWTGPNSFTATTQNLTGLAAGTYDVTVTDANGCSTTAQVTISSQVGITENNGLSFDVYPNPTNGMITIKTNTNGLNTIRIMDATGNLVMSKDNTSQTTVMDISHLSNGIYFIQIKNDNTIKTSKIVLQY